MMQKINHSRLNEDIKGILDKIYDGCVAISEQDKKVESTADTIHRRLNKYCPTKFDGWLCWNRTRAGHVAKQPCPGFIEGFTTSKLAYKKCEDNGSWFLHPESKKEWSNYTTCVDTADLTFREFVNDLYVVGYTISFVTLLISLIIFFGFRSLRCTRIRIHVQLFLSLIISCSLWITWYKFVVDVPDVIKDNPTWCVALHLLIHFFMLSNYMWMFCEGIHLHLVLVVVFVKDTIALRWFYLIGWGIPFLVMSLYCYIRYNIPEDSQSCWIHESKLIWILIVPVTISLFASLMFLVNVIRILLTKLHPCSGNPAPVGIRRAARATFILVCRIIAGTHGKNVRKVPLFGLQNFLLPLRPDPSSAIEPFYQIASAVLISLQGFCVSILFCFVNHDVLFAIKCYMCKRFPEIFNHARRDTSNNILHITPSSRDANL